VSNEFEKFSRNIQRCKFEFKKTNFKYLLSEAQIGDNMVFKNCMYLITSAVARWSGPETGVTFASIRSGRIDAFPFALAANVRGDGALVGVDARVAQGGKFVAGVAYAVEAPGGVLASSIIADSAAFETFVNIWLDGYGKFS
jgi:hypothetical protein